MDLTEDTVVSGVITQGDPTPNDIGHLTKYKVAYRTRDSPLLKYVSDAKGEPQVTLRHIIIGGSELNGKYLSVSKNGMLKYRFGTQLETLVLSYKMMHKVPKL